MHGGPQEANVGSKMGWERATFLAPDGEERRASTRGASQWLPWSAAEQANTRTNVAVFEQTSFYKYLLGRAVDAEDQELEVAVHRRCRRQRLMAGRSTLDDQRGGGALFESEFTVRHHPHWNRGIRSQPARPPPNATGHIRRNRQTGQAPHSST